MIKKLQIISILFFIKSIDMIFIEGNFTYCEEKSAKMPLLDYRRSCADIIQSSLRNESKLIIKNEENGLEFIVFEELKPTTKAAFCYRVKTTSFTKWSPLNLWSYQPKLISENLPVSKEQCEEIKKGYCDIGTDRISPNMVKLDCFKNHCSTRIKPEDGFHLFWNYKKEVINCHLEELEINEYNPYVGLRTDGECLNPPDCNTTLCTCFTKNSFLEWKSNYHEVLIKQYVGVQFLKNIKVKNNILYDSNGMYLAQVTDKKISTPYKNKFDEFKLEYPWIASQELSKELRFKRSDKEYLNFNFTMFVTKQNIFLTNDLNFIKWIRKEPSHHFKSRHVLTTNFENYDKNLLVDPLSDNFDRMLTLQDAEKKNSDVFKFLKRYNDFQMCNSWKINLNILSLFEHEFVRIYDFSHVPYIIYSKRRQIYLPKCSRITQIAILNNENHNYEPNMCSKDLPIIYMIEENIFQGYMNTQSIIHSRSILVPCKQIDQLYIIPVKNPKFDSNILKFNETPTLVFYLYRRGKNVTLNKKHVQYYDEIDPFNYDRNHFNFKYDVTKHVGQIWRSFDFDSFLNVYGPENIITNRLDRNRTINDTFVSQISNINKENDLDTLCMLVLIINIATSVLLFVLCESFKRNNVQNQIRYHQRLRLKYLQLKKIK